VFRDNGLTIVLMLLFAFSLDGQWLCGWHVTLDEAVRHGQPSLSLADYAASPEFLSSVFENWESEFLQMAAYVVLTAYLIQRGSAESENPDQDDAVDDDPRDADRRHDVPWAVRRGGVVLKLYEHSLAIAFSLLFVGSMVGHALGGVAEYNDELRAHGEAAVSTWQYVSGSQFWFESFQNWQSEFLAMFAIVVLTIFLREKGSSESKPVAAPHAETGTG